MSENQTAENSTFCVDIRVGYDEEEREELIEFLKEKGNPFDIVLAQRGMWEGVKILRVETPKANDLIKHIMSNIFAGDDYEYEVHETRKDAFRSDTYLPDYDSKFGHEELITFP